jgi:hypothetical protein
VRASVGRRIVRRIGRAAPRAAEDRVEHEAHDTGDDDPRHHREHRLALEERTEHETDRHRVARPDHGGERGGRREPCPRVAGGTGDEVHRDPATGDEATRDDVERTAALQSRLGPGDRAHRTRPAHPPPARGTHGAAEVEHEMIADPRPDGGDEHERPQGRTNGGR